MFRLLIAGFIAFGSLPLLLGVAFLTFAQPSPALAGCSANGTTVTCTGSVGSPVYTSGVSELDVNNLTADSGEIFLSGTGSAPTAGLAQPQGAFTCSSGASNCTFGVNSDGSTNCVVNNNAPGGDDVRSSGRRWCERLRRQQRSGDHGQCQSGAV